MGSAGVGKVVPFWVRRAGIAHSRGKDTVSFLGSCADADPHFLLSPHACICERAPVADPPYVTGNLSAATYDCASSAVQALGKWCIFGCALQKSHIHEAKTP